jgi:hypothetical protein
MLRGFQGLQGPAGLSSVISVSDTVFVSKTGNDQTGRVGDPARPFLTLNAAVAAAKTIPSLQRTIRLTAGTFNVSHLTIDVSLNLQGDRGTLIVATTPLVLYGDTKYTNVRASNLKLSATDNTCLSVTGKSNFLGYGVEIEGEFTTTGGSIITGTSQASIGLFHSTITLYPYPNLSQPIHMLSCEGGISVIGSTLVILGRVFPTPTTFGPIVFIKGSSFIYMQSGSLYIEMENPLTNPANPLGTYNFQSISLLELTGTSDVSLFDNSLSILSLKFVGKDYDIPIGDYFYLFSPTSTTAGSIITIQGLSIDVFRRFVNPTLNFPQDTLVNNYTSIHTDVRSLPDVGFLIGTEGTIKPQGIAPNAVEVTGPFQALLNNYLMVVTQPASIVLPRGYNGQTMVVINAQSTTVTVTYNAIDGSFQEIPVMAGNSATFYYLLSKDRWYGVFSNGIGF